MMFAENLLEGYYSPPNELNLWNGPAYPLFLSPFVKFGVPLLGIKVFNALFQYLSIVFLFYAIKHISDFKQARFFGFVWAAYYVSWQTMPYILTESISIFFIALLSYFIVKSYSREKNRNHLFAGITLGLLALTKVIFAYVILTCLAFYAIANLVALLSKRRLFTKEITILLVAFIPLIPYLLYTYKLTDKVLYFANSGGMSLYFMSTPYEGEFGEWNTANFRGYCDGGIQPCNADFFLKNHKENFDYIYRAVGVERDRRFKEIAIKNIKKSPIKFLRNCLANQGRMWFRYPFSYRFQNDLYLGIAFPNAVLFTVFLYVIFFWLINSKKIKRGLNLIFILLMVYLGGSTLLSAYPRQLYVVAPMILILAAFAFHKSIKMTFSLKSDV